ncbi:MAG: hypothetical protein ACR2L2_17740 [Acidobacteriota bacterium]
MEILLSDPILLASAAVAAALILVLIVAAVRRRPAERPERDADAREGLHRSISQTMKFFRRENATFGEVLDHLLADVSLDDLLKNEQVEIAFGKLSYLSEKGRKSKSRKTSLLNPSDDEVEMTAAMVSVLRACYLSDDFSDRMRPHTKEQFDLFLEKL